MFDAQLLFICFNCCSTRFGPDLDILGLSLTLEAGRWTFQYCIMMVKIKTQVWGLHFEKNAGSLHGFYINSTLMDPYQNIFPQMHHPPVFAWGTKKQKKGWSLWGTVTVDRRVEQNSPCAFTVTGGKWELLHNSTIWERMRERRGRERGVEGRGRER